MVRVLGTVRVGDSTPSSLGQALLATLAAAGQDTVSGERLAELCWGRIDRTSAGRIRTALSRLRQHLPEAAIVHEPGGYRLALEPHQVDAWWFDALVHGRDAGRQVRAPLVEAFSLWPSSSAIWAGPSNELIDARHAELMSLYEALVVRLAPNPDAPTEVVSTVLAMFDEAPARGDLTMAATMALHRGHRHAEAVTVLARHRAALAARGLVATHEIAQVEQLVLNDDLRGDREPAGTRSAVPGAPSALIGRGRELAEIDDAARRSRHVSLVGLGGIGKTRLAIEFARRCAEHTEVRFVSSAGGSSEPAKTIANDLGFHVATITAEETLTTQLRRAAIVLVLDACEGTADEIGRLVDELLRSCPQLRVVTTSRRPLGNDAEVLVHVGPLTAEEAGELLRARLPRRRSTAESAGDWLSEVARRLDHLPLAIELAASRLGTTSVDALLAQLSEHATSVSDGHVLDRVLAGSFQMVSASTHAHLDALAVMVGPFDEELFGAVARCSADDARDALHELTECSIVDVAPPGHGPTYRALDTVQQFAMRRALQSGTLPDLRRRHAEHLAEFVSAAHRHEFTADAARVDAALRSRLDHLRSAFEWSVDSAPQTAIRIVRALHEWSINHLVYDVNPWAERVLVAQRQLLDDATRAELAGLAASAAWFRGDERAAASFVDEAVDASRRGDTQITVHTANTRLALAYADAGAPDDLVIDVLTAAARDPDPFWAVNASVVMALGASTIGLRDAAEHFAREAARAATSSSGPVVHAWVSYAMGVVALPDAPEQALVNLRTAEGLAVSTGAGLIRWMAVTAAAAAARLAHRPAEAAASVSAALQAWTDGAFAAQVAHCLRESALQLHAAGDIDTARLAIATADSVPLSLPSYAFDGARLERVRADTGVRGPHPPAPLERLLRTNASVRDALESLSHDHDHDHDQNRMNMPNDDTTPDTTPDDARDADLGGVADVGRAPDGTRRERPGRIIVEDGPDEEPTKRDRHGEAVPLDIVPETGGPEQPTDEKPPL